MNETIGTGPDEKVFTGTEELGFFTLAQDGSVKIPDLFRAWERLAPQWWEYATGAARDRYWKSVQHFVVSRYAKVTCASGGWRVGTRVKTRLVTTAGTRPRSDGGVEAGAVDRFEMRDEDGALVGAVEQAWTWMDASSNAGPRVARQPPPGLRCAQHSLPAVEKTPSPENLSPVEQFTWSVRETDINRHVSFLSYFDRADNALARQGPSCSPPRTWEAWYRRECVANEPMTTLVGPLDTDGLHLVLVGDSDQVRRVVMRHRSGPEVLS